MRVVDPETGIRGAQVSVTMRDGCRLNTFVYLPASGGSSWPVIVQRTPYGIAQESVLDKVDPAEGWLPDPKKPMWGALMRGWKAIAERGYAVVYQDCRGRHASEGIDRVYADDADDGEDTLAWVAAQPWCDGNIGMCGSSAAATTTLAAASRGHPALKCFWAQVGGASIYDDVVYEGQSIEMERLWLWVAGNIPGLSRSHREMVKQRFGLDDAGLEAVIARALDRAKRLEAAKSGELPFVQSEDWMRLPLLGTPDFSLIQPFLDEILSHPMPDAFRAAHDFRRTIGIPGFHVTTWYDIFQTSVIAAFQEIQARAGNQKLWIGPNAHYFIYESQFWPRDPFFEWFGHWLKGEHTPIVREPAVLYSPRAWVEPSDSYRADDWRHADAWPPAEARIARFHLGSDGQLALSAADQQSTPSPIKEGRNANSLHGVRPTCPDEQVGATAESPSTCSFRYDPRRPVPSRGGRNMLIEAGPRDQAGVRGMADYGLTYRGAPLEQQLTLAGPVVVHLKVSSDCPDTDFIAKLIEVDATGTPTLLMDGVVRAMLRNGKAEPLEPGEPVAVTIPLGHIHHVVPAGNRLELDVTSSNFPRRARNTNSGNLLLAADSESQIRIATNALHHDSDCACTLELTIMA